jgi:hypothetical protein
MHDKGPSCLHRALIPLTAPFSVVTLHFLVTFHNRGIRTMLRERRLITLMHPISHCTFAFHTYSDLFGIQDYLNIEWFTDVLKATQ